MRIRVSKLHERITVTSMCAPLSFIGCEGFGLGSSFCTVRSHVNRVQTTRKSKACVVVGIGVAQILETRDRRRVHFKPSHLVGDADEREVGAERMLTDSSFF